MLWYLAAPISPQGSETVEGNLQRALSFQRALLLAGIQVVAPYIELCQALDEGKEAERKLGMAVDMEVLSRCDAIVLVGPRISSGMTAERNFALLHDLKIHDATGLTDLAAVVECVLVVERLAEFFSDTTESVHPSQS